MTSSPRNSPHHSLAFSLLELLSVLAVIGVLAGMLAPAVSNLARGNDMNRAVVGVAGMLDLAREHAVSKNTYAWVVLAGSSSDAGVRAVILGSQDGSNTADGVNAVNLDDRQTYDLSSGAGNLALLQRAAVFPNVTLEKLTSNLAPASAISVEPNDSVRFRFAANSSSVLAFLNAHPEAQRVVQFSPNGQARVSNSLVQAIELGVKPVKGTTPDETNVCAIQVNGLTGRTQVFRP